MEIPTGNKLIICQKWEEIERGWGTRPDGFSLHVSIESLKKLIVQQRQLAEEYPEEFSVPDGQSYPYETDDATYQVLVDNGGSKWYPRGYSYPHGSVGGWQPSSIGRS